MNYTCVFCERKFSKKYKLNRHLISLHKVEPQDSPPAPSPAVNRPIARSLNVADFVAKQWYDHDRSTFAFVKILKEPGVKINFVHQKDFDDNGVIYWIATNGRTVSEWVNPAQVGLVMVTASEGRNFPYGCFEDIRSCEASALNCHANDDKTVSEWVNPAQFGLGMVTASEGRNLQYGCFEDIRSCEASALNCHANDDKTVSEWVNPAQFGLGMVTASEGRNLQYGCFEDIRSCEASALNCHANDDKTVSEWVNPAQFGLGMVTASEGRNLQYGCFEDIRSCEASALNCHANDDKTVSEWVNPAQFGLGMVTASEGRNLQYGCFEDIRSCEASALNCHANDDKTVSEWVNPAQFGLGMVTASEGRNLQYGCFEDIRSCEASALNCHANDDKTVSEWVNPAQFGLGMVTASEGRNLQYGCFEDIRSCEASALNCHANDDKTVSEWVNPAQFGLGMVTASEGRNLQYGCFEDIRSCEASALNCHANDDKRAWFAIDLGLWLIPNCYTLKHARGYGKSALRNWLLQVSKDGFNWLTLFTHVDDCALNEPGSTASWPLDPPADEDQGWRHVRLQQTEKNASGETSYLSLSGFEIYGTVTGVCDDLVSSVLYPTPGPFIMPVPDVNHPYSATITGVLETVTTELKLNLKDHILRTVEDYFFNRVEEWYNENFNKKSVPPIPVIDLCDEENEENGMSSTQTTFTRLKFNPPIGPSMTGKESTHVRTRYQCISCMKEYENKSLEELRVEDYAANRKGLLSFGEASQTGSVLGSTPIASTSGFSFGTTQSKLLFGITGTTN